MRPLITFVTLAIPALGLVVLEELPSVPHLWTQIPPVPANDNSLIRLHVSLKYRNLDLLEATLAAVSTPCSPQYGQYQDLNDQWATFAPSNISNAKVTSWLQSNGAKQITSDGVTISFTMTVGQANAMMDADFQVYQKGNESKLRTKSYSVPHDVAQYIDIITPTTYFDDQRPQKMAQTILDVEPAKNSKRADLDTTCFAKYVSKRTNLTHDAISPECLRQMYNTVGYEPDPNSGSSVSFSNFINQTPIYDDLFKFEKEFKLPNQTFDVMALINGATNNQTIVHVDDNIEANLDVQVIVGQAGGLPVSTYSTGGSPPIYYDLLLPNASSNTNEPWLEYYNYLLKQPNSNLPYVLSHSYGDHENTVPDRYAARVCNQIGMLGLRGRSVLYSSGDEGVGAVCRSNRPLGNMRGSPEFTSQFPASCPWVTSVGGTQGYNPSIAWNASSGGFSRYFKQPWYQKAAVETYLANHISPETKTYYDSNNYVDFSGRAFPDISSHSLYPYYLIYINGIRGLTGGTSAAAPVAAGIIALLNDARLRAGLPALGFLNPWLYSSPNILQDVTTGTVLGCNGTNLQSEEDVPGAGIIPYASWNATIGWDPATGLGVADFQKMKASALQQECTKA